MAKIKVKAAEGRRVVFPLDVMAAPGRAHFALEGDQVVEVEDSSSFVTRRLRAGDLMLEQTLKRPAKDVGEEGGK